MEDSTYRYFHARWLVSRSLITSQCALRSLTIRSVCVASIYRAVKVGLLSHRDASWADVDPCVWAVAENGVGK